MAEASFFSNKQPQVQLIVASFYDPGFPSLHLITESLYEVCTLASLMFQEKNPNQIIRKPVLLLCFFLSHFFPSFFSQIFFSAINGLPLLNSKKSDILYIVLP